MSPALQVDSLPAEPPGKPKNIGVGSLSLLQQIFPTQELNWGLLHCRQILYQLSYQGSLHKMTDHQLKRISLYIRLSRDYSMASYHMINIMPFHIFLDQEDLLEK